MSDYLEKNLYSYYNAVDIKSGLTFNDSEFLLNEKPFQILSGSLHYFRIFPDRWKESIKKMKNCHLNTVCTYVPWNLHEDKPGIMNFYDILDLEAFIKKVQEQDMFLILRIGPYICAEIDFGGLPSWLLKDKTMKLRTNYPPYLDAVKQFFIKVVTLICGYQFSLSGGPIIAIQIENEFGSYGDTQANTDDYKYMVYLKDLLVELGIKELMFTCDMLSGSLCRGSIPDVLITANFQTNAKKELGLLKKIQPNKPMMVTELWSGWFDHWGEKHNEISTDTYLESLKTIISSNASFNIYVFQGGTNFGFSNGANIGFPLPESAYSSTVTSYDYGALLTESGNYTEKYFATLSLLKSLNKEYQRPEKILDISPSHMNVENLPISKFLPLNKMLPFATKFYYSDPVLMEDIGQRFGFILYETKFAESGVLKFCLTKGTRTLVLVNSAIVSVVEHSEGFQNMEIKHSLHDKPSILWIFVENLGRINYTENSDILNNERRGVTGPVTLNNMSIKTWNMYVLDFNKKFNHDISLLKWDDVDATICELSIGLYKATLNIENTEDAFISSSSWHKGIVIVNGFNVGRYWKIGPQKTLFVPKQIFKSGLNEIFTFELQSKVKELKLSGTHVLNGIERK